jgi:hypothetical protein
VPTESFEGEVFVEGGNLDQLGGGGFLSGPLYEDSVLGRGRG